MIRKKENNNLVVLLQSGGRDSAIAASNLLTKGIRVLGITLAANAASQIALPKKRAEELYNNFSGYAWAMVEFCEWEKSFKLYIETNISQNLPTSCLICALSKITAAIKIAREVKTTRLALGYVDYQNTWAEQTEYAIDLQRRELQKRGIELILPAGIVKSKSQAETILTSIGMDPMPLENPCCISKVGTKPVSNELTEESINLGFSYFDKNNPTLSLADSIGNITLCL